MRNIDKLVVVQSDGNNTDARAHTKNSIPFDCVRVIDVRVFADVLLRKTERLEIELMHTTTYVCVCGCVLFK